MSARTRAWLAVALVPALFACSATAPGTQRTGPMPSSSLPAVPETVPGTGSPPLEPQQTATVPVTVDEVSVLAPAQATSACVVLPPLPGSPAEPEADRERARRCRIDFASPDTAVCPKTWSTSPAALVYDLSATPWAGRSNDFQQQVCARGRTARSEAGAEMAVFKTSVNGADTSATYAPASLLYDHLSRWLKTRVHVPVAVRQQFPVRWYREQVAEPGLALATEQGSGAMLRAGWARVVETLAATGGQSPAAEMLSPDGEAIWGASLLFTGKRYGSEVNGTRASGWGVGQNRDFQQTAPYLLLRNPEALEEATREAISVARSDSQMAAALPADIDPRQIQWWAGEVLEIAVLDFLLGQQDRIGNIDYQWRWHWLQDGQLRSLPDAAEEAPPGAVRLRATWLNDNDAGIRVGYTNYAQRTGMVEGLRRFDPNLYRRLRALAADFEVGGVVSRAIGNNYGLRTAEVEAIARRVVALDQILRRDCLAGRYQFDLAPGYLLAGASGVLEQPDCG